MFRSILTGKDMENDTPTRSFWHWLAPVLSAVVSVAALAGLVFYTGGAAQRLQNTETILQELKTTTVKHSELDYRLDSVDKTLDEIKGDVKELRKHK